MKIKLIFSMFVLILFNQIFSIPRKWTGVHIDGKDRVVINAINAMSRQDILDNKTMLYGDIKIKDAIFGVYHSLKYNSTTKTKYFLLTALANKNLTFFLVE